MKNYISTQEGLWKEIIKVELTEEEQALLRDFSEGSRENRRLLLSKIKAEREVAVEEEVLQALQSLYTEKKPEGEPYQLIQMYITEKDGRYSGILNCRVKDKHVQIRY